MVELQLNFSRALPLQQYPAEKALPERVFYGLSAHRLELIRRMVMQKDGPENKCERQTESKRKQEGEHELHRFRAR